MHEKRFNPLTQRFEGDDEDILNVLLTDREFIISLANALAPLMPRGGTGGTSSSSASSVSFSPSGDIASSTVQTAIEELDTEKVAKATYDAHTVLYATTDNTPVALTVTEQTLVGRATGGNISAIAIDADLSAVSGSDDTIPSAKATKAMGDAKLALAGGTMTGDIQLGETDIKLDAVLSGDEKWSGIVLSVTAGSAITAGEVCFLAADGKWDKVDGILDGTDTGFNKQLGICVDGAAGDTSACEMLIYGKCRSAKFPALTVGSPVYLHDTAGELVVAQPSSANFAIRIVGYAITAEDLLFNPSNDYIVHL